MKILFAVALCLMSSVALAAGDAAAGKAKAATCGACHGANGVSLIPNYPNLAGQKADYIVGALKAYKAGERKGGNSAIMSPMSAGLSEQDMMDLAAYYSEMDAAK